MTIGITGANGFIGRHFVRSFLRDGHTVVAFVRQSSKLRPFIRQNADFSILEADICNDDALAQFCGRCDVIIHLAAGTSGSREEYEHASLRGTELLLQAAKAPGSSVKQIIFMSSVSIYDLDKAKNGIITEETPIDENIALRGLYAQTKAAADNLLMSHFSASPVVLTVMRAGLVYAKNMPQPLIGCGLTKGKLFFSPGTWNKKIPFIHIDDLYNAVCAVMNEASSNDYIVTAQEQPKVFEIVETYKKYVQRTVPISIHRTLFSVASFFLRSIPVAKLSRLLFLVRRNQLDIYYSSEKLHRKTNWTAKRNLEDTMKEITENQNRKIQIGIIGCGEAFTSLHLPAIQANPDFQVSLLWDVEGKKALSLQKAYFPDAAVPDSLDDITPEKYPLDSLIIITPAHTHAALAEQFLAKGFDILLEKPVCLSPEEARRLEKIEQAYGGRLSIIHNYRLRSKAQDIQRIVSMNGTPNLISVRFWSGPLAPGAQGWRSKLRTVLLHELAYHFIDLAILLGGKPTSFQRLTQQVENGVITSLEAFASNQKCQFLFDFKLTGPRTITTLELQWHDTVYELGFFPERLKKMSSRFSPLREILQQIEILRDLILNRSERTAAFSHRKLYSLYADVIRDHPRAEPLTSLSDAVPVIECIEEM